MMDTEKDVLVASEETESSESGSQQDDTEANKERKDSTNNNSIKDLYDAENQNEGEDLNLGDTSNFSTNERNLLFQRGIEYERKKKPNAALECYTACLKGLKRKTTFVLLPQCLHNIADIYRDQGDYERAIQFAQAEKLFYETSLVETEEIRKKLEEVAGDSSSAPSDLNELNLDALRAEEYEHLAKLCLDKNQQQLALEYAGKCTRLRQQVYGENHEKTQASLNLFATIYAEVGKLQYADSINLLNESTTEDMDLESLISSTEDPPKTPEVIMSNPAGGEPVSILRQRSDDGSKEQLTDRERKQVRFHESVDESERRKEREELASLTVTLILFAVCIVILASMGMWLYCSLDRGQSCQSLLSQLHHWLRTLQYYFHTLTTEKRPA